MEGSRMEVIEVVSLTFILLGLFSSNMVTWILYRYHSSILYIKRNILTYLSMLLVFSMNLTSNSTNIGVLVHHIFGNQDPIIARLVNDCLYLGFYMFLATNVTITVFRILLVIKPDKFWNADHERVFHIICFLLFFFSIATICFVEIYLAVFNEGMVQSPIEVYLTGNDKDKVRVTHLIVLWGFLACITFFMTISRLELRTYMRRQKTFRSNIANPQVKNTVTFKTLTFGLGLLGIVSTPILISHNTEDARAINKTAILVILNLVNIVSNIFLLTYLFHNQEAIEYLKSKMKNFKILRALMRVCKKNRRVDNKPDQPTKLFRIRNVQNCSIPPRESLVTFSNDIALIELDA